MRLTKIMATQAKDHEIYDTTAFLKSKVFKVNGYKANNGVIEKTFRSGNEEL